MIFFFNFHFYRSDFEVEILISRYKKKQIFNTNYGVYDIKRIATRLLKKISMLSNSIMY